LWDEGWTETANTRAAGELFERVGSVAPLLCRPERDYGEEGFVQASNPQVLAHSFKKRPGRPGDARYVVLVSLDGFGPQSFDLTVTTEKRIFDLLRRDDVTDKLTAQSLPAGEGTLLLIGTRDEFEADCALIDGELLP